MAEELKDPEDDALHQALLKADRSASLGPLAAGLANELNDLLTRIIGAVHRIASGSGEAVSEAEQSCLEGRNLTRRLASLAAGEAGNHGPVGPRPLLEEAARLAAAGSVLDILIEVSPEASPVWVDAERMSQAFRALVRNAAEAMSPPPPHPRMQLKASNVSLPEGRIPGLPAGDYVEFEFRDNGCGIPAENLEKIWEPFFTTKKHGSGLGLSAALAVVRRHGGQIGVDSAPGSGTVFTVYLPSRHPPPAVRTGRPASERFRTGRILVMDDDAGIRAGIGAMLERLDYKCDLTGEGDEALAFYRRYFDVGRPYDAVLLDQTVVGDGRDLLARIRALDADARAIALCGDPSEDFARSRIDLGYNGTLAKPFRLPELAEALKAVSA